MNRITYNLLEDVKGQAYSQLLHQSLMSCRSFILVIRNSIEVNDSAQAALKRLAPFVIQREDRSEWPGTQLFGDTAQVSTFKLSHATASVLAETAESLFSWTQPELPEDLCLLREDGEPWLVTITHERDGYLVLSYDESAELTERIPGLHLVPDHDLELE